MLARFSYRYQQSAANSTVSTIMAGTPRSRRSPHAADVVLATALLLSVSVATVQGTIVGLTQQDLGRARTALRELSIAAEVPRLYKGQRFDRRETSAWGWRTSRTCTTRQQVLQRDSLHASSQVGQSCSRSPPQGPWACAYSGVKLVDAPAATIDHVVPLAEAWDSGAHAWGTERRREFANDLDLPFALQVVAGTLNMEKGDKDPAEWLPPYAQRCQYVVAWILIKAKWQLAADDAEYAQLKAELARCTSSRMTDPEL